MLSVADRSPALVIFAKPFSASIEQKVAAGLVLTARTGALRTALRRLGTPARGMYTLSRQNHALNNVLRLNPFSEIETPASQNRYTLYAAAVSALFGRTSCDQFQPLFTRTHARARE